ncbi:uncharacterized protein LOC126925915 [Bombus affinis]|uniref:uncharacterized protein LOC126925915 n=1 Tax=Bombus affinis TaxID=309941 RepID=UPI0021B823CD|nr:uncharacterized protein LOC126925915 [Bombus affinis]
MRVPKKYNITLTGEVLNSRKRDKYLGVVLDSNRNYCNHFDGVCNRANAIVGAIRGLLLNMNGLSDACRKLYCQVWESVVLYVSPVWMDVLSRIKTVGKLCRVQRGALIITSTAYRTVSHAALKKLARPNLGDSEVLLNQLHLYEEEAVDEWRREWTRFNTNNWTRRLIENAVIFRKRKRSMDHYTMQLLSRHGIFNTYRVRINKETVDKCWDCDACPDGAEHALLRCPRWADQRITLENVVGDTLTVNNTIALVSADDHTWGLFRSFCGAVMRTRQA